MFLPGSYQALIETMFLPGSYKTFLQERTCSGSKVSPKFFCNILLCLRESSESHQAFTCSKLTTETLKKKRSTFKVNYKDTRTKSMTSFWTINCQLYTYSTSFSSVSLVDLELVSACWGRPLRGLHNNFSSIAGSLKIVSNLRFLISTTGGWKNDQLIIS